MIELKKKTPTTLELDELLTALICTNSAWERAKVFHSAGMQDECFRELKKVFCEPEPQHITN